MTYKIQVSITLRPSILDPQGKAARHALNELGHAEITQVRMGKFIEMWIDAKTEEAALEIAEQACKKLLANPVMEDYSLSVVEKEAAV